MNFIIQKLKNKHIFLKKLSNWAKLNSLILREREETITKYFAPKPSLQKFNPNPKFLGTAKAYFVCHIGPIFQISLIYAFIGCPFVSLFKFHILVSKQF